MQCRALNCNPTFAASDMIDIGRRQPHVVVCFRPHGSLGRAAADARSKIWAFVASVAIRPARIA